MPTVLSPTRWGARVDYDSWNDPFTPDDGVALHHGGGSDYPAGDAPFSLANEVAQLRSWENYHLSKGWRGLAYGWGVGQTGTIMRIRGFNKYGAHSGDMDGDGIANNDEVVPIIWIASGNYHTVSPAAQESIEWLRQNVIIPKSPRATRLYGHQEVSDNGTSCPGPNGMTYVREHRVVEDDMTPEQTAAVNWLVNALKSKPTDSPAWGATWWNRYKKHWGATPPGPEAIVTHLQEAYVIESVVADAVARAIADAGTGTGVSEEKVKEIISQTKLLP